MRRIPTDTANVKVASWSKDALDGIAVSATDFNADIHASAEYRAHLVGVMARRAVAAAG